MQLDWFTVGAQVFNFVFLVWLLKRFLYRPVLDAVARREEKIRGQLEDARRKEEEAAAARRDLEERRGELEERRAAMLREAEEEAQERRRELSREVREEVRTIRDEWRASLRRQQETFLEELRRRVADEIYSVVRRVLADLADAELEDRVAGVFLERLSELEAGKREEFVRAARESGDRARVRSAFPLGEERRGQLREIVDAWETSAIELHFEEEPALALGIELGAGDRKIAWSVGSYLEALEADTEGYLEAEAE